MKRLVGMLGIVICAVLVTLADELSQRYSTQGELISTRFASAPFPHPERAGGHKYKDQFFASKEHYSDSTVAVFVPRNFRLGETVDFVVHFHGWKNHVASVLDRYKLIEQLIESRRNVILVVPQGPRDASDSFGGKLENSDGFKRFMDEVLQTVSEKSSLAGKKISAGSIILSGHSGGYHVISSILDRGGLTDRIKEVWLFDGLYAQTETFIAWAENRHGRFLNIYTDGGGTKAETEKMMASLAKRDVSFTSLKEKGLPLDALRSNRPVFIHTELQHDDVLDKHSTFRGFLLTSCLRDIEGEWDEKK